MITKTSVLLIQRDTEQIKQPEEQTLIRCMKISCFSQLANFEEKEFKTYSTVKGNSFLLSIRYKKNNDCYEIIIMHSSRFFFIIVMILPYIKISNDPNGSKPIHQRAIACQALGCHRRCHPPCMTPVADPRPHPVPILTMNH